MNELNHALNGLQSRVETAIKQLKLEARKSEIAALEKENLKPNFWQQTDAAAKSQKLASLKEQVDSWEELAGSVKDLADLARLEDSNMQAEIRRQYDDLKQQFEHKEFELKLNGPYDHNNAILSIHAGTGGTDAMDWAEMLLRMYIRYGERSHNKVEIVDRLAGDEAGIKSATLKINGEYAYGKLKGEHGVHRLVRLSPFNADNLRQTSFALVEVIPELEEADEIELDEKDLKIDTFRSSGRGGQSVNTTDSAVRVTHILTDLVVTIQNERSQLQNKETALKILKSKLAKLAHDQRVKRLSDLKGHNVKAEWGQQIRNYVLHPYTLVKDTRTKYETKDAQSVLDGNLADFIETYLQMQIGKSGDGSTW